jgi:hypothetical protein
MKRSRRSFARTAACEDTMLAMGTVAAKLLRASACPSSPPRGKPVAPSDSELLGQLFEVAAPSGGAYGDTPPTGRQVYSFLRAVIQTADVSQSSVICSFVLMMRFLGSARLGGGSWQLAWLVAICLAQKNIDDIPLCNSEFGTVLRLVAPERAETAVDTARFNDLELVMLRTLRWRTHLSAAVFDEVLAELGTVVEDGRRDAAAAAAAQAARAAAGPPVHAAMDCTGDCTDDLGDDSDGTLAPPKLDIISPWAASGLPTNGPATPSPVTACEFPHIGVKNGVSMREQSREFPLL